MPASEYGVWNSRWSSGSTAFHTTPATAPTTAPLTVRLMSVVTGATGYAGGRLRREPDCRCGRSAQVDLEPEARETLPHGAVERLLVLLASVLVERPLERVADVGEGLGALLDEVDVLAVALLGLVSLGVVVPLLGLLAVAHEVRVILLEQVELARDHVDEALAAEDHAAS